MSLARPACRSFGAGRGVFVGAVSLQQASSQFNVPSTRPSLQTSRDISSSHRDPYETRGDFGPLPKKSAGLVQERIIYEPEGRVVLSKEFVIGVGYSFGSIDKRCQVSGLREMGFNIRE